MGCDALFGRLEAFCVKLGLVEFITGNVNGEGKLVIDRAMLIKYKDPLTRVGT
jgi:hypothetical protein